MVDGFTGLPVSPVSLLSAFQSLSFSAPPSPPLSAFLGSAVINVTIDLLTNSKSIFSNLKPGAKPTAGKQQSLDLSPVHLLSEPVPFLSSHPSCAEAQGLGPRDRHGGGGGGTH